ncbi:MAG: hypothetical protein JJE50_11575 [Actinomycetales bacterium]|nr:hypothetical protein [Actinomycetales bacterium]
MTRSTEEPDRVPLPADAATAHREFTVDGRTRKVSGSRAFVAATAIEAAVPKVTFEQALSLVALVLRYDGGPVPAKGRKAPFGPRTANALHRLGLAEKVGSSQITPNVEIGATEDLRDGGSAPLRYSVHSRTVGAREKSAWHLLVTDSGRALVEEHLPR